MIVPFTDNIAGVPIYINPDYVVARRPDPVDPLHVTVVKLEDGEVVPVRGDHQEVADKLSRPS